MFAMDRAILLLIYFPTTSLYIIRGWIIIRTVREHTMTGSSRSTDLVEGRRLHRSQSYNSWLVTWLLWLLLR